MLVPLYLDSGALHAVFTKRRDDLKRHAGEISFPGGRQDFPDEDLRTTALREAEEEIGLAPADVELVGALEPVGTFVTNYKIHPFVGVIKAGPRVDAAADRGRGGARAVAAGPRGRVRAPAADPQGRAVQDAHLHRRPPLRLGRDRADRRAPPAAAGRRS